MNTPNNISQAYKILLAGAVAISFSPGVVKLLTRQLMGPVSIAFWRTFIGSLALLLVVRVEGRKLRMAAAPTLWCLFTGLVFFLDLTAWHTAIIYVGSGMSTLLGNTHVFATAVVSYLVFKEKLTPRFMVAAVVGVAGLSLLVGAFSQEVVFNSRYILGLIYGFITALMYAFYMVGIKKATSHKSNPEPVVIMTWICMSAAFFLAIASPFETESFLPPDYRALLLLLWLGVIGQAAAWWGIANSIKQIAIHHASLILLLQPVLAMIWGYLIFHETLTYIQVAGAAITLIAIYAGSVRPSVITGIRKKPTGKRSPNEQ